MQLRHGDFAKDAEGAFGMLGQDEVQQVWLLLEGSSVDSYHLSTARCISSKLHTAGMPQEAE